MNFFFSRDRKWRLLVRHVTRASTREEDAEVQALISVDDESAESLEALERLWEITSQPEPAVDTGRAWERIRSEVEAGARVTRIGPASRAAARGVRQRTRRSGSHFLRLAAVVLGAALVSTVSLWALQPDELAPERLSQVFATSNGQRATVQLSDGTLAKLRAGSRLEIPFGYSDDHRTVHLQGEAYFQVPEKAGLPFLVQTSLTTVEVVGTAFNVRAYAEATAVQVAVAEGSVALHRASSADTLVLRPRELGTIRGNHRPLLQRNIDLARYLAWTEGYLVFHDAAFSEVAAELERWYDLQVELVGASAPAGGLTATFGNESLSEILHAISLALDLEYERKQRRITFFPASAE